MYAYVFRNHTLSILKIETIQFAGSRHRLSFGTCAATCHRYSEGLQCCSKGDRRCWVPRQQHLVDGVGHCKNEIGSQFVRHDAYLPRSMVIAPSSQVCGRASIERFLAGPTNSYRTWGDPRIAHRWSSLLASLLGQSAVNSSRPQLILFS